MFNIETWRKYQIPFTIQAWIFLRRFSWSISVYSINILSACQLVRLQKTKRVFKYFVIFSSFLICIFFLLFLSFFLFSICLFSFNFKKLRYLMILSFNFYFNFNYLLKFHASSNFQILIKKVPQLVDGSGNSNIKFTVP